MKTIQILLFFLALSCTALSQSTDPLAYHTAKQLSDTSYSIKKANGDSTVFLFEGGNAATFSGPQQDLQNVTDNGNVTRNKIKMANLNLANVSTYATQDTAIKYGLVSGDIYKLPPNAENNRLLAIVDDVSDSNFNLIIDNSNNDTYLKFYVSGTADIEMTINWGDGSTVQSFTGTSNYEPEHTYSTPGIYHVSFTFNDYSLIDVFNAGIDRSDHCNISAFHNANLFTKITELDVEGTGMKVWSYSDGFAPTIKYLWFSDNYLSSAQMDKLLMYIDSLTFNEGGKELHMWQLTSAEPGPLGMAAISSLESKGWSVY
ncbi:MAG: hypothetical protein ACTHK0_18155 [Ginsengibacter sp.]